MVVINYRDESEDFSTKTIDGSGGGYQGPLGIDGQPTQGDSLGQGSN
jgi:hypothetical protein